MCPSRCRGRARAMALAIGMAAALPSWPPAAAAAPAGQREHDAAAPDAIVHPSADGADQADALQRALDALQRGQRLVLAPGRYVVGHALTVKQANVAISGYGATLIATDPEDQTIELRGDGTTLAGLTLVGAGSTRLTTPASTKVDVTGRGVQVLDVVVDGGASAGIFVFGGQDVAIVGNEIRATLADGIHVTHGAHNVLVQGNVVRDTGDDMIAVVSYRNDGAPSGNVLIAGNSLEGNEWGRGVTVVGGADVTIADNIVRGVQTGAGILVAQEDSYRTHDTTNVRVAGNAISDIQQPASRPARGPLTGQAAIDLNAGSGKVTRVEVTDNRIARARFAGVRMLGNVCGIRMSGNRLDAIGGAPIAGESRGCAAGEVIVGAANTLDGAALPPSADAASQAAEAASGGADARLMPHVREWLRQARRRSHGRPIE
ncbi:right-handed parallel beta-helix repeat-containing protein [Burkholderia stagnalis]|nr:right-handed parallel beta-helix repeat-containing protein [Burkholderia stagnalis]RQY06512.1 right-handed parallel beta-helix repeat-containing protein [Burkholderia stagnalis]RQY24219.1 right-handed parallel beta-helix repeat-containing protein [Burkholderia stagnalis]RQY37130.1 right-handed parallel beta-helix repeat-containing protein [Burkholderia stagnalis]